MFDLFNTAKEQMARDVEQSYQVVESAMIPPNVNPAYQPWHNSMVEADTWWDFWGPDPAKEYETENEAGAEETEKKNISLNSSDAVKVFAVVVLAYFLAQWT